MRAVRGADKEPRTGWDATIGGHLPALWLGGALAISMALVGTTCLASVTAAPLLSRLSLAGENNAAAWWSGILLALASIHAFDGYARWRRQSPVTARAWASIAIALIVLSADEVGSIHERVEYFSEILDVHDQLAHLPFGLVLLGLFAYALSILGTDIRQRCNVVLILVALGLFISVAAQELIEEKLALQSATLAGAIRVAIEEGTELAGILILLKVTMSNTAGLFAPDGSSASPVFEAVIRWRRSAVLVVGLAMASVLAVVTASFADQHRGHPADWLAAVIFLAAALAASRRYFIDGASIGRAAWALAVFCVLASVFVVDAGPDRYQELGTLKLNARLMILGAGVVLMCGICALLPRSQRSGASRGDVAAVAAIAVFAMFGTGLFLVYWLTQVLALAVYLVIVGREIGPKPSGRAMSTVGGAR